MNINFVITDITGQGGTERTTCNLASTFAQKGDTVTIISLFKQNHSLQFPLNANVQVKYLIETPYVLTIGLFERVKKIISVFQALKKTMKKLSADSRIISQSFLPSLLIWLAGKAKETIVCEHFKYGIYGNTVCKLRDSIYGKFKCLVLLTDSEKDLYAKTVNRISVIENMVIPSTTFANLNSKRIISAGRLSHEKGFDMLIDAAKIVQRECPDHTIEIYGEGNLKEQLCQQINDNHLENYIYIKNFTKELQSIMISSSIYVLSSRHEAQPMVMLEAMNCGMAVIAFNCSSSLKTMTNQGAGILVEPENPTALAQAIIQVANDAQLRQSLSDKALLQVQKYSPNTIYNKWYQLLNT